MKAVHRPDQQLRSPAVEHTLGAVLRGSPCTAALLLTDPAGKRSVLDKGGCRATVQAPPSPTRWAR